MEATLLDERTLSELDHQRLSRLIVHDLRVPVAALAPLDEVPDSAEVLPSRELAPDIVTMNSCVLLLDAGSAELRGVTLCYPADSDPAKGFVSVLSPVGMSLLGLRAGSVATWRTPDGDEGSAELLQVHGQAGRLHPLAQADGGVPPHDGGPRGGRQGGPAAEEPDQGSPHIGG